MVGYTLSSEEFGPTYLVTFAQEAESCGFEVLGLSDHFHPWTTTQGQSPFSWAVAGAVVQATKKVELFMEVVCPIMRYHPAIVAQAAATTQLLSGGRFILGLGSGENLNEHIIGQGWPPVIVRQDMLREATDIIRKLFTGKEISYYGAHFTVEQAKLYSMPTNAPPIIISAFGPKAATLAGEMGDGLVSLAPKRELLGTFDKAGGAGKPKYAQIHVCYAKDEQTAKETTFKYWPNSGLKGPLSQELRLTQYFDQAVQMLTPDTATEQVTLGPDPEKYLEVYKTYKDAGYDHIYFHQIGPNQQEFLRFYKNTLKAKLT